MEFSCKCEVPGGTQVSYQWLKDDQELEGKTSDTLLLDSVRIQDFGLYRCQVSRSGDTGMEPVKSEPAELIVTPGLGKSENYCCAFFFLMKHRLLSQRYGYVKEKVNSFLEPRGSFTRSFFLAGVCNVKRLRVLLLSLGWDAGRWHVTPTPPPSCTYALSQFIDTHLYS